MTAVLDALEAGDDEGARALVEPLHPADIADLFELVGDEERVNLARAVTDLGLSAGDAGAPVGPCGRRQQ